MSPLAAQTQAVTGIKDASVTASAWPKPGLPSGGSPDTRTGSHTGIFQLSWFLWQLESARIDSSTGWHQGDGRLGRPGTVYRSLRLALRFSASFKLPAEPEADLGAVAAWHPASAHPKAACGQGPGEAPAGLGQRTRSMP